MTGTNSRNGKYGTSGRPKMSGWYSAYSPLMTLVNKGVFRLMGVRNNPASVPGSLELSLRSVKSRSLLGIHRLLRSAYHATAHGMSDAMISRSLVQEARRLIPG